MEGRPGRKSRRHADVDAVSKGCAVDVVGLQERGRFVLVVVRVTVVLATPFCLPLVPSHLDGLGSGGLVGCDAVSSTFVR